jgi:hypothetical protein
VLILRFNVGLKDWVNVQSTSQFVIISGWTYPSKTGWKTRTIGDNGCLELAKIGSIQMRGRARTWGKPTTCTLSIVMVNGTLPLPLGWMKLREAIQYKVTEAGGLFVEVPTKTVKPSQTCPNCGNQHPKTLDERVHQCQVCGFSLDRDLAAALVMLLWLSAVTR